MAARRDAARALKFCVGSRVMTYPFKDDASGWSPVLCGEISEIAKVPNADKRDSGLFRVAWDYVGTTLFSLEVVIQRIPSEFTGSQLRFES